MAITDDLRKTFSNPTPLYFAAGTADLALQQAKKVPALVEQLRTEAPARIEAVRNTDPKAVQERATVRVRETQENLQNKVGELFGSLDTDLKKLGENAQDLALRGVGIAAEYAVKARETYEKVAEHGEQAVRTWRGDAAEGIEDIAVAVEPPAAEPKPAPRPEPVEPVEVKDDTPAAVKKPAAKKAPARKSTAKKTTPPAK
jgi:heparin binding hemagglutinin HbhA